MDFLAEDDFPKKSKVTIISHEEAPIVIDTAPPLADSPMKDGQVEEEHKAEATEAQRSQFKKHLTYSRILILQFLNRLIADNVDQFQIRSFFVNKKVMQHVADCLRFESIQVNVEIIKFFKAIVVAKDTNSVHYMIKKDIFDSIIKIFLSNKNKGNLLHSCILNLFEMLTPADNVTSNSMILCKPPSLDYGSGSLNQSLLNKLYNRMIDKGHAKTVFFAKEYSNDFRKFNKHLSACKNVIESSSEADSKKQSDRNRSSSVQRDKYEDQLEAEMFGGSPNQQSPGGDFDNRFGQHEQTGRPEGEEARQSAERLDQE